jgi:hypothetical protein
MPKHTNAERQLIKTLVASLSLERIPDLEIMKEVEKHTGKSFSRSGLYAMKQRIKKDSYKWYQTMRDGQFEYIHEFKDRINEIIWLQKKHHEIIDSASEPTTNKQSSLAELHRLNITLSNYFDVAPAIVNYIGFTVSTTQQSKAPTEDNRDRDIIV